MYAIIRLYLVSLQRKQNQIQHKLKLLIFSSLWEETVYLRFVFWILACILLKCSKKHCPHLYHAQLPKLVHNTCSTKIGGRTSSVMVRKLASFMFRTVRCLGKLSLWVNTSRIRSGTSKNWWASRYQPITDRASVFSNDSRHKKTWCYFHPHTIL